MKASSIAALPRVFPTVVHMLADTMRAIPGRDRARVRSAESYLRGVFAMRRGIRRRIGTP